METESNVVKIKINRISSYGIVIYVQRMSTNEFVIMQQ